MASIRNFLRSTCCGATFRRGFCVFRPVSWFSGPFIAALGSGVPRKLYIFWLGTFYIIPTASSEGLDVAYCCTFSIHPGVISFWKAEAVRTNLPLCAVQPRRACRNVMLVCILSRYRLSIERSIATTATKSQFCASTEIEVVVVEG